MLERIWGYGFVDVGELNYRSACYITKYILKKIKVNPVDDWYYTTDAETGELVYISPEFVGMSRGNATYKGQRCGIGAGWYEQFKSDVFPHDHCPVPGQGVMPGVPRYYTDILRDENPTMYEQVKEARRTWMREHAEEYTDERLLTKHKCKKARVAEAKRNLQ